MAFDDRDVANAFTPLEPPPGGLAALRTKLQREDDRQPAPAPGPRRATWSVTALATAAAAAITIIVAWPDRPRSPSLIERATAEQYSSLVSLGLAAPPSEPVTLLPSQGSALRLRRVPSRSDAVVFYLAQARTAR